MEYDTVLSVSHLSKQYKKGVQAVHDISFSLHEGEIFGLLGPNGSGKTTTILMVLGLLDRTEGTVRILGYDPYRSPLAVKQQVGYMPDTIGFYEYMTAYENLDYTARFLGLSAQEREKRIGDALASMHLTNRMYDKVRTFSHGMKRRLGLAELLVKQPKIAILDEPTQGLDPQSISEFLALIASLRKHKGMTILLSSHQLDEVQSVCDRVGLFSQGTLLRHGSVEELGKQQFGSSVRIALQAEGNGDLSTLLKDLDAVQEVTKNGENRYLITASRDIRPTIAQTVLKAGCNLSSLELQTYSLQELYQLVYQEVNNGQA